MNLRMTSVSFLRFSISHVISPQSVSISLIVLKNMMIVAVD